MTRPFPEPQGSFRISVTDQAPNYLHDWPPGGYQVPRTNLFVSFTQGGEEAVGPAVLFGMVGMEVAGGDRAKEAQKKVKGFEDSLQLNLPLLTQRAVQGRLTAGEGGGRYLWSEKYRDAEIQLTPYADLNFVDDTRARLWTVLKVDLVDPNFGQQKNWTCRYIVGDRPLRPVAGKNGWGADGGTLLIGEVQAELATALDTFFRDVHGQIRDEKKPKEKLAGRWIFYKKPHQADVQILERTPQHWIVLPQVEDDEWFAGINVIPADFEESLEK